MGIRFGPIDPLQLIFEIINELTRKGIVSAEEAERMIKTSLDPALTEEEKNNILKSLRGQDDSKKKKDELIEMIKNYK